MASLLDHTLPELTERLGSRARALELLKWAWAQPAVPSGLPARVAGVSHRVLEPAREHLGLPAISVHARHRSSDGTTKYAIDLGGTLVETVRIPAEGRATVCVSSQAGCTRNCGFCATATMGFRRQLTTSEMVAQVLLARAEADAHAPVKGVVFMGMGEPFDNLDAVLKAVQVLTQAPAPQLKLQSVTVSTSGVLPGLKRFLKETRASLALSLNATTDEVRARLMPQNKTWPIASLLGELKLNAAREPKREHFIEYILFDGVNDSDADAERLVQLLDGIPARINLIPFNAFEGNDLRPPTDARVLAFQAKVVAGGRLCLVRWPRGREVNAACGQLALAG